MFWVPPTIYKYYVYIMSCTPYLAVSVLDKRLPIVEKSGRDETCQNEMDTAFVSSRVWFNSF